MPSTPTMMVDATLNTAANFRSWNADFEVFRAVHPGWPATENDGEPVYCLPEPAIDLLSRPTGLLPGLFDREAVQAEYAFTKLCASHHAVGSWMDLPLVYPLLRPALPMLSEDTFRAQGWTTEQIRQARVGVEQAQDATSRLKGYVGWLLTEPAYLEETVRLAHQWRRLPTTGRPTFPLRRPLVINDPGRGARSAGERLTEFVTQVEQFLDRWGLMYLVIWELPAPQGPLLPDPLPPNSPARPAGGVRLVLPLHYPLQGNDGLLGLVQNSQQQAAREMGLAKSLVGLPHYKAYAAMFDVIHLERTIRSRLLDDRPPRGLIGVIENAATVVVETGVDNIKKYRKAIAQSRDGKRASIRWLRAKRR